MKALVIDDPMQDHSPSRNSWKQIGIYSVLLLIGFLLGAVPLWLRMQGESAQKEALQGRVFLLEMENNLASSLIDLQRNDYPKALEQTSRFFTQLNDEAIYPQKTHFNSAQMEEIRFILAKRDETIAMLARKDPSSLERLSKLYDQYQRVMGKWSPHGAVGLFQKRHPRLISGPIA